MHSRERPQGLLTYADRAYLLGETTPATDAAERKKRERIRRRIRNALVDFSLLVHLEWRDLELVFSGLVDEDGGVADRELYEGIVDAIETMMRGTTMQGLSFGRMVRLATLRSVGVYHLVYRGVLVDVELTHETRVLPERSVRLEDVPERVDRLDEVPLAGALALEEFGVTTLEDLYEFAASYEGEPTV
ncbi:hypothetical protein [Natronobiforma cellulositropha]|uniref:hypothetical protein n=1 Tax=Natronobiforma cellulositropha TaxID=1679076 RepID=UPI0021D6024D|nr:hypothetical protein [Natronobiforma cellulositropha]